MPPRTNPPGQPACRILSPLGFILGIHGGDHGIDHRLHGPIAQGHDERSDIETPVALGQDGDRGRGHVAGKGEDHGFAVTDSVHHQTEKDDTEGKGPQSHTEDLALLCFAEIELGAPLVDDLSAHDEAEGGGHQSDEAGPEQSPGVGIEPWLLVPV